MGFYLGGHALWCHKHTGVQIASETGDDFFNLVCRDLQTISSTDGLYAVSCGTRQPYLTAAAALNG